MFLQKWIFLSKIEILTTNCNLSPNTLQSKIFKRRYQLQKFQKSTKKESISSLKIGILFNSAGIAEYKLMNFTENTYEEVNS